MKKQVTVKLHPIKNIPELAEDTKPVKRVDLLDVVVAYLVAIASMLFAGVLTTLYGATVGFVLTLIRLDYWILGGLAGLGLSVGNTSLVELGALSGFVSFCFSLTRISRRQSP